jgi:hypothetical protein
VTSRRPLLLIWPCAYWRALEADHGGNRAVFGGLKRNLKMARRLVRIWFAAGICILQVCSHFLPTTLKANSPLAALDLSSQVAVSAFSDPSPPCRNKPNNSNLASYKSLESHELGIYATQQTTAPAPIKDSHPLSSFRKFLLLLALVERPQRDNLTDQHGS